MADKVEALSDLFWKKLDERIDLRVGKAIDLALQNYRPKGLCNIPIAVGYPGVSIAADASNPLCFIDVPFPGFAQQLTIRADPAATLTIDIYVQRPGQARASALSMWPVIYPGLTAATDATYAVNTDWRSQPFYIEADSILHFYVISNNVAEVLTVNLWLRCV